MILSSRARLVLLIVAVLSFVGTNGVFLYFLIFRTRELFTALMHPAALVFEIDVLVVLVLLATWFARRPLGRWTWKSFVVLSFLGGLGFSIPAFVLLNSRTSGQPGIPGDAGDDAEVGKAW
jgi:hypothetical protein